MRLTRGLVGALAGLVVLAALVADFNTLWWWIEVKGGVVHETGPYYGFWSGVGSVFVPPILNVAGVAVVMWWHHKCHVTGCPWYARRTTAAGERACWLHHADRRRTAADLHAAHHAALHLRNHATTAPKEGPL